MHVDPHSTLVSFRRNPTDWPIFTGTMSVISQTHADRLKIWIRRNVLPGYSPDLPSPPLQDASLSILVTGRLLGLSLGSGPPKKFLATVWRVASPWTLQELIGRFCLFFSPMPLLLAYGTMGIEMAIAPLWVERQIGDDRVIKRKLVLYTK